MDWYHSNTQRHDRHSKPIQRLLLGGIESVSHPFSEMGVGNGFTEYRLDVKVRYTSVSELFQTLIIEEYNPNTIS